MFQGQYQEFLRSVGAWLDARGYSLTLISESGNSLVIEVQTGASGDDPEREVLRLDIEALNRLATPPETIATASRPSASPRRARLL